MTLNSLSGGGGAKRGATGRAEKISGEMRSACELSDVATDIAPFSSFMDGGCIKHGDFKKAEEPFERLRSANLGAGQL